MRVLAIDPGYGRTGIAILERRGRKDALCHSECFCTDARLPHGERLNRLRARLEEIIKEYEPDACAAESLFFTKNRKTAMAVAEARGVMLACAARGGLLCYEYTPPQVKLAVTGYGKCSKHQVMQMVKRLLSLEKPVVFDDEYDAIAVGLTHLATRRT